MYKTFFILLHYLTQYFFLKKLSTYFIDVSVICVAEAPRQPEWQGARLPSTAQLRPIIPILSACPILKGESGNIMIR